MPGFLFILSGLDFETAFSPSTLFAWCHLKQFPQSEPLEKFS